MARNATDESWRYLDHRRFALRWMIAIRSSADHSGRYWRRRHQTDSIPGAESEPERFRRALGALSEERVPFEVDPDGKQVQNDVGFSAQFTWVASSPLGRNQFSAGFLWDRGSVDFTQNSVYGYINPNYTITSVPAWLDGSTGSGHSCEPPWRDAKLESLLQQHCDAAGTPESDGFGAL